MSQETLGSGRSRRARKQVDYNFDQAFDSGDDVFEDDPPPTRTNSSSTKKKSYSKSSTPRKSTDFDFNSGSGGGGYGVSTGGTTYQAPSRPAYVERGYDLSNFLPLRERFTFEPEYEEDGTQTIELIVGRRPIDDAKDRGTGENDDDDGRGAGKDNVDEDDEEVQAPKRRRKKRNGRSTDANGEDAPKNNEMDYEYLVKYKGRSYLHLEWHTAADLESMNTKAKTLYRRFLKKLETGEGGQGEEDLEDPTFDPSYTEPGRILAEEEHEITVELSDKELLKWEKEQKKLMEGLDDEEENGSEDEKVDEEVEAINTKVKEEKETVDGDINSGDVIKEEDIEIGEPGTMTIEDLRRILAKEEPYYAKHPDSDNPYRDGYFTEPPRKPRPSYLFYQGIYRSYFGKKYPRKALPEVMAILGDSWKNLTEEQQLPYVIVANEELVLYEKEKELLERAQKPSEMWQPIRRCMAVLDRLCDDPFASIFLEPVPLDVFTDYLDIVESPMDLQTIRERMRSVKNWQGPEVFARDVRKVWNNCKIYNQHGSQIWHVADYMSKLFERLYHAWVLDFRDRYLRWVNPAARPWEPSCRASGCKCNSADAQLVLCDHCDAMYNIECLKPPLSKVPKGAWHCPTCAPKVGKNRTIAILSAEKEQAARKRAEMGDIPKKQVKQKMFLVKWAGLGYEQCTWETQEDINDDAIIAEFRRIEGVIPDEPNLMEKDVRSLIESAAAITPDTSGLGGSDIAALRLQLHAQTRNFQFKKFGMDTPKLLGAECGPQERAMTATDNRHPSEVVSVVEDIVWRAVNNDRDLGFCHHQSSLPPLLNGEYDVILPVTSSGLLLNVGESPGGVAFLGYRQFPDGSKGPSEERQLLRKCGDIIIAVNGRSTVKKSFKEIIPILKESKTFAYMRFVQPECIAELHTTSCGSLGRFLYDDLSMAFKVDRRRVLAKRTLALTQAEGKDGDITSSDDDAANSEGDSDSDSEVEIEPDSEDEALVREKPSTSDDGYCSDESPGDRETPIDLSSDANKGTYLHATEENGERTAKEETSDLVGSESVVIKLESTRNLAYRVLGIDVGYSSDEGGDEDAAYYVDGVDGTFTRESDVSTTKSPKLSNGDGKDAALDLNEIAKLKKLPLKKTEYSMIGKRAQLQVAIALTTQEPDHDDFDKYPLPSDKQIAAAKKKLEEEAKQAEEEARQREEQKQKEAAALVEAAKPKKKSKTKVEQVCVKTSDVVRIWATADDASVNLGIPLESIQKLLKGEYDAELGDEVGGHRWRYADADAVVTTSGKESKKGRAAYLEYKNKLYDPAKPHVYKNGNKLRDYQVEGVNWLSYCYYKEQGAILADEMGLGKTVQIVSYLEHLHRVEKISGPFLVVVPLSTVEHWRREFEGWTDMQCCVYHDRQRVWRDVLREYEWYYEDRPHTSDYLKFNVVVTTYDTLISDFDVIGDIPWRVAVVDEAHRLRNVKGKLLECMKEISTKGTLKYQYQSRVLMTGTPLQNNTQELWTLLNYIQPQLFSSLDDFEEQFGNMANREQVESLQRRISPFMLRRVKEDVAKDIPAKEETVIDVELTSIQKQYYRAIFEHNHAFLSMGSTKNTAPKLMNIQMELRKCCNHPFLLDGVESREMEKRHEVLRQNGELDNKTPDEQHDLLNHYGYVLSSGKMVLLDKLLPKLRAEGHKVLIFSQFVKMLDLISDYCEFKDFRYERLDGRVRGSERQKAIDRFETEKDSFMFLLSTRAGGVGINLTAADICIIYDSDWNPQNDVQAQARCHRIGQTKDVMIYRLVTSRTFEQEMFDRASKKLGLEQAILGTFDQGNDDDKPTSKEMEQLLKRGAYALLEDENDEIGKEFVADDIESILEKRTRTRVVEGAKTASWLNKKGMNVTKSKFASDAESQGIDVDDPLFWQKVMPDFVTPEILLRKLDEMEEAFEKPAKGRKSSQEVGENDVKGLTRGKTKKVAEYMSDLKGVMEDIFDQDRDDSLNPADKEICQKLLLCITLKPKLFNESQRATAQKMLDNLDGDRRRKCRTSNIGIDSNESSFSVPKDQRLMIVSSKKKKGRKSKADDDSDSDDERRQRRKKKKFSSNSELDDDGYLKHSDDEGEWSDVDEDIYKSGKKAMSMLQVKLRREWGAGKDPIKLAGMPWPVFPRTSLMQVLGTLIDEVIKIDKAKGGIFCDPVPKDEFPEYYEVIKQPMDYGTMKLKLENGEYRSAQAMQKDFSLVNANCLQFNAQNSDIVREAQRQTLMRPKLLKDAALKNLLFIDDAGNVIDVIDDNAPKKGKKSNRSAEEEAALAKRRKRDHERKMKKKAAEGAKSSGSSRKKGRGSEDEDSSNDEDVEQVVRTPKIRIKISSEKKSAKGSATKQGSKRKATPQKKEIGNPAKKAKLSSSVVKAPPPSSSDESDDDDEEEEEEEVDMKMDEMFDFARLQSQFAKLNATSWEEAYNFSTKLGPWRLPVEIESKFKDVAKITLSLMSKADEYDIFKEPVTDDLVAGYSEHITSPMDFSTMLWKIGRGEYGDGSDAAANLYADFLLVFDNCYTFNDGVGDVVNEAMKVLQNMPIAFAKGCQEIMRSR